MRYDLLHPKALRAALIEAAGEDVVPTERQVRRWVTGETPIPGWARRAIQELMGTTKEAAPPAMEERLARIESMVRLIAAERGIPVDGMDDIYERVLELERARQRPDVLDPSGGQRAQDAPPSSKR